MKIKLKHIYFCSLIGMGGLALTSCNDFLDRSPISDITPEDYFNTVDQVGSYVINYYDDYLENSNTTKMYHQRAWNSGVVRNDANTDNLLSDDGNLDYFAGNKQVPEGKNIQEPLNRIRVWNYLFEKVLPKEKEGTIPGDAELLKQYIGEAYFFRALAYYNALVRFGDYPIITEVLPDDSETLIKKSQRAPRNEVARFILKDLDEAVSRLKERGFQNNQRINKQAALVLKSRVALFEATFEKYHQGTGRVPGDPTWPGAAMSYNSGKTFDIAGEINFFLTEAMQAAVAVADHVQLAENSHVMNPPYNTLYGWNPYFEMFSQPDLSNVEEVLLWKQYNLSLTVSHCVGARLKNGDRTGLTRSLIKTFLMKDGLPIYASNSTIDDRTVSDEKKDRDERLQLFVWGEKDAWMTDERADTVKNYNKDQAGNTVTTPVPVPWVKSTVISDQEQTRDITGYRSRKFYPYDDEQSKSDELLGTNACPIFRASEAYLNYIEACYEKNGTLDSKAQEYWKAIRRRAGVDEDYQKTIARTDLEREDDLGVYSGDRMVDATLYNIRRERRCEFIAEGMRWDDLKRWRSWDRLFTEPYIVEGINFWDEAYKLYTTVDKDGNEKSAVVADGSTSANMSPKSDGKYVRPLRRTQTNNQLYDGYTWKKAYYLEPLGLQDLQLSATNPEDINTSMMYQNPYWPAGTGKALE
ncbi:RagB/SusD family nutrient uptake outer membrane protein [Bacteroides fragilis]|jgi:hypothetical protein|uniref:RagB/SusD family nutrient uptake outer membrane protein n=1 Tax=Bacteroides fragilis TaxID=817 RepID=UPI000E1CFF4A|nr:RagB/SusD family nutrient uptake outer membrane protein [Bacteroides fragilis]MBT9906234.1 RagB/SusD family nutrient uptake outer membrane protein [Bacteroides fragilis]MCS2324232.1 RagB/SusD family nutrient uptake outer membrane protein [Bacteroides fragilis]RDT78888.1 RagB/SusD family nutrient uptake outer membrane protein [Bacteroides fragilis]